MIVTSVFLADLSELTVGVRSEWGGAVALASDAARCLTMHFFKNHCTVNEYLRVTVTDPVSYPQVPNLEMLLHLGTSNGLLILEVLVHPLEHLCKGVIVCSV